MKRILIIRFGALGDIFQTMPCFEILRNHYGDGAHITLLTEEKFASVFDDCPWFDEIMAIQKRPSRKIPFSRWWLARKINKENFDVIIDLHINPLTKYIYKYLKPQQTIWYGLDGINGIDKTLNEQVNSIDRNELILDKMGVNYTSHQRPNISWLDQELKNEMQTPYIVFFMSSSQRHPQKSWALKHYITLANSLTERGFAIALIGGEDAKPLNQKLLLSIPQAKDFTMTLNWKETASLLRGATAMIGNDSGPVHLSCLLNIPTWVLFHADYTPKKHLLPYDNVHDLQAKADFDLSPDDVLNDIKNHGIIES